MEWHELPKYNGIQVSQLIYILAGQALLVKMLIALEPRYAFRSNVEYLCILTLSSHWYEKSDKASPSIILAGRALLV